MAIRNLIARGIGFNPGSVKFIVTHGFGAGAAVVEEEESTLGGSALAKVLTRKRAEKMEISERIRQRIVAEVERRAKVKEELELKPKSRKKKKKARKLPEPVMPSLPDFEISPAELPKLQEISAEMFSPEGTSEFLRESIRARQEMEAQIFYELLVEMEVNILAKEDEDLTILLMSL